MRLLLQEKQARKERIMEACFDCYSENGLSKTSILMLGEACGIRHSTLYAYFDSVDDLIVESAEHCMAKVEAEFMARAPKRMEDLPKFLEETPRWTARRHGKKYRLMYQIYSSPKYIEQGKRFFAGVQARYTAYARELAPKLGIPWEDTEALIFLFVRATVHYAMFGEEHYLRAQIDMIWRTACMLRERRAKDTENIPESEQSGEVHEMVAYER